MRCQEVHGKKVGAFRLLEYAFRCRCHIIEPIKVNQPYHGLVLSPYGTKAVSIEDLVSSSVWVSFLGRCEAIWNVSNRLFVGAYRRDSHVEAEERCASYPPVPRGSQSCELRKAIEADVCRGDRSHAVHRRTEGRCADHLEAVQVGLPVHFVELCKDDGTR